MFQQAIQNKTFNYNSIIQSTENGQNLNPRCPEPNPVGRNAYDVNPEKIIGHRPRAESDAKPGGFSELVTKFDPVTDRHLWAMWRTAVNGRLVDKVKTNEKSRYEDYLGGAGNRRFLDRSPKPEANSVPSLGRFIRLDESSQQVLRQTGHVDGEGQLNMPQFVFYGLPRANISGSGQSGSGNNTQTSFRDNQPYHVTRETNNHASYTSFINNARVGDSRHNNHRMPPPRHSIPSGRSSHPRSSHTGAHRRRAM